LGGKICRKAFYIENAISAHPQVFVSTWAENLIVIMWGFFSRFGLAGKFSARAK